MAKINLDVVHDLDITCRQGDTFSLSFTLKTSAGVAIDVSSYAFYMQIYKPSRTGSSLELSTTNTTGSSAQRITNGNITITGTSAGLVTIAITSEVMKNLLPGSYNHELQFNTLGSSSGTDTTLLAGVMTVVGDLTMIDDR